MHFSPGLSHASVIIEGRYDGWDFEHTGDQTNRQRYALLALLYGLTGADDHQFIYEKAAPHLVYSVDHGHFFAGGPEWTVDSLHSAGPAVPDVHITRGVMLSAPQLRGAVTVLDSVSDAVIASAVASPPDSWSITMDERITPAQYLAKRRDDLLALRDSWS